MTHVLGQLTWYTIHDTEVSRDHIAEQLRMAGLPAHFAPPPIHPADAFRRATSAMETRRIPGPEGVFENYLVREVRSDKEEILRHLVKEVVDASNRRLDYRPIAHLRLNKTNQHMSADVVDATDPDATTNLASTAHERYQRFLAVYQGRHLREVVLSLLRSLSPVAVRPSGGVYFVPAEYEAVLGQIQTFVQSVHAEMWRVPMMDMGDSRAVLSHSVGQEVETSGERLVDRLTQLLGQRGTLSDRERVRALDELERLQKMTQQYSALLDDKLLSVRVNLEVAQKQVRSLFLVVPDAHDLFSAS